jgi:hypothetical protein
VDGVEKDQEADLLGQHDRCREERIRRGGKRKVVEKKHL